MRERQRIRSLCRDLSDSTWTAKRWRAWGRKSRITTATEQKNEAEAARFKGIVTMYESMKPKDAAKVFDRLEMSVLFEIASQIAPRKMSDILGLMSTEAAERLTIELARRAGADKSASAADLPKIEGKILPQKSN
jgi:flagellar motility protein MotE (MotC chaperone)